MTTVRGRVALSDVTTLRLGGAAGRFDVARSEAEIVAGVRAADERGEPLLVLGGGSNLVVSDAGFPGTVLQIVARGIGLAPGPDSSGSESTVDVTIAAGEPWDAAVQALVAEDLAGLECLSGIPGLAGATPIQNVGAYGQEVAQAITSVRAYDRHRGEIVVLAPADCGFGYRTSVFKRSLQASASAGTHASAPRPSAPPAPGPPPAAVTGRFVVLSVTLRLIRGGLSMPVRYPDLARSLDVPEGGRAPLHDVRAAVLGLRRGKGMVLDPADPDTRSAGSFFTNPILSPGQFAALERAVRAAPGGGVPIPCWPAGSDQVKVSAAWLIEQAGFSRGFTPGGGARISTKHTLALVNPGTATTAGLISLAAQVRDGVRAKFGVDLAPEPVLVGVTL